MFLRTALLSLSALAAAKEMPKDDFKAAELYDSGIRHANNVALKKESWARQEAAGMYKSAQYAEIKDKVECVNGTAITGNDVFRCQNVSSRDIIPELQQLTLLSDRSPALPVARRAG
ncbi:hypothetical protein PtrSN002B_007754 [Pyrenophora tritici-repentis]|uniref:Uncharacterized protein n=1 Tax=Pyrenophora tritici-repentis TaxID=45151 RepID=A0A2W1E2V3_9PLEO|nr:hypothetical protein PtrV1_03278 [Pyrenophora tritici-repentis]KAF7579257.1 hypothetical protein PtrM4_034970 [Pyrenophora tritici-repentis]KAI1543702.1 hypothetical protein PtrSN002B_007754 [Pyrenophora tritici-repentis]KAI1586266.1 hypothetical protein PtrEW7m1_001724 [Pyrenophora tritici-repentis]KAI1586511.1 hypothetical protein PtrEW13061_007541 [Pyrenophora tritici-repentis]